MPLWYLLLSIFFLILPKNNCFSFSFKKSLFLFNSFSLSSFFSFSFLSFSIFWDKILIISTYFLFLLINIFSTFLWISISDFILLITWSKCSLCFNKSSNWSDSNSNSFNNELWFNIENFSIIANLSLISLFFNFFPWLIKSNILFFVSVNFWSNFNCCSSILFFSSFLKLSIAFSNCKVCSYNNVFNFSNLEAVSFFVFNFSFIKRTWPISCWYLSSSSFFLISKSRFRKPISLSKSDIILFFSFKFSFILLYSISFELLI